jgi:hypothetical protein
MAGFSGGSFSSGSFSTNGQQQVIVSDVVVQHGGTGGSGRFKRRKRSYWGDPDEPSMPFIEPVTVLTRTPFSTAHADELKRLVHLEYEASKRRKRNRIVALVVALIDE